jgi:hypothetical protein
MPTGTQEVTRAELVAQLEGEAAQGWPVPWWPQDQANPPAMVDPDQDALLIRYVDLVAAACGLT